MGILRAVNEDDEEEKKKDPKIFRRRKRTKPSPRRHQYLLLHLRTRLTVYLYRVRDKELLCSIRV